MRVTLPCRSATATVSLPRSSRVIGLLSRNSQTPRDVDWNRLAHKIEQGADFVVTQEVVLEVNVVLRGTDGLQPRRVVFAAVLEQADAVATHERCACSASP